MERITSKKNQNIIYINKLNRSNSFRKENNCFVLEGIKLISEAVLNGFLPLSPLYITEKALNKKAEIINKYFKNFKKIVISEEISSHISDNKASQGMFCIFKAVDKNKNYDKIINGSRLIILDGLQDTGNVGAIFRTAEAFGFDGILLSDDSVDLYSPKLIRASMGSVLRIPCIRNDLITEIKLLKDKSMRIIGSILDKNAVSLKDYSFPEKSAIIIGSEGRGITDKIKALCDDMIFIEISNTQSLNAAIAAAIFCWEMSR